MSRRRRSVVLSMLAFLGIAALRRTAAFTTTPTAQSRSFANSNKNPAARKLLKKQRLLASAHLPGSSAASYKKAAEAGPKEKPEKKAHKIIKKRAKGIRADRVLANRGYGSRSECFEKLRHKRVKVWTSAEKFEIVAGPSQRLNLNDRILVDGKRLPLIPLLLAYHKPKWILSVMSDPKGRPNLSSVLSGIRKNQGLHPVGRLDYDSSGLLLFSSNGPLTQKLLHPKGNIEKEYVATVEGIVEQSKLTELLTKGVKTSEGTHTAVLSEVEHLDLEASQQILKKMRAALPKEYNKDDLQQRGYLNKDSKVILSKVTLTVKEGKHRMVRRMLANCGHGVVELMRTRHGMISMKDDPLEEGSFRELTEEEEAWAQALVPTTGRKNKNRIRKKKVKEEEPVEEEKDTRRDRRVKKMH